MNARSAPSATALFAGLAVAVVAVSTSAILVRFSDAPSTVAALYRVVFTALLVTPVAVRHHVSEPVTVRWADLLGAGLAGLALAVHFAAWFESLEWTSVAASVTLVQTQPVVVAVGAWLLLSERVTWQVGLGVAVALAGASVLTLGDLLAGAATAGAWPAWGNGLALLGALAGGAYVLAGRSIRQRLALFPYVALVYGTCAVGLLAVAAAADLPLLGYPPREWLLFLAMAVVPGLLGHTVVNWALGHLESSVVAVALLGEPVGSALLAAVFLGEVPGAVTVLAAPVVLLGVALTARYGSAVTAAD